MKVFQWEYGLFALFLLLLVPGSLMAQEDDPSTITYHRGIGIDANLDRARASALNALTQEIQVFVSSSFESRTTELNQKFDQQTFSNVMTRSLMDLREVKERYERLRDGTYRVVKFVSKEAVAHMFGMRRQKILEHINIAEHELQLPEVNLGSVFKHFYWAYLLGRLYPDTLSFRVTVDSARTKQFSNVILGMHMTIDDVLKDLSFQPKKMIDDEMIVWRYDVRFRNKSVTELQFNYYDGMGQTEGEVKAGETKLTFFFSKKEMRDREVLIDVEYHYCEEMDDALRFADSLLSNTALPSKITILLPGQSIPFAQTESTEKYSDSVVVPTSGILLPGVISDLLQTIGGLEPVITKLRNLERQNLIITGNLSRFESMEGLYGLVLGQEGAVSVVQYINKKLVDARNGKETDMAKYAGKRITWIEVLR